MNEKQIKKAMTHPVWFRIKVYLQIILLLSIPFVLFALQSLSNKHPQYAFIIGMAMGFYAIIIVVWALVD